MSEAKCLDIIKDIALIFDKSEGKVDGLMGDIFISEDDVYFIPYVPIKVGLGNWTVMGFFEAGLGGALVGQMMDNFTDSFQEVKPPNEAKKITDVHRNNDFGSTIEQRFEKRKGVKISRESVTKIEGEQGNWCKIESSNSSIGTVTFQKYGFLETNDAYSLLSEWIKKQNKWQSIETLEGSHVGIPLKELMESAFPKKNKSLESSGGRVSRNLTNVEVQRIIADKTYLSKLYDSLIWKDRNKVHIWFDRQPSDLRAAVQELQEEARKDKFLWLKVILIFVCGVGLCTFIIWSIKHDPNAPILENIFFFLIGVGTLIGTVIYVKWETRKRNLL